MTTQTAGCGAWFAAAWRSNGRWKARTWPMAIPGPCCWTPLIVSRPRQVGLVASRRSVMLTVAAHDFHAIALQDPLAWRCCRR